MGDIAAVVRGLRAGGATDVVILDGHGPQAFVPAFDGAGGQVPHRQTSSGAADGLRRLVRRHRAIGRPRDDGDIRRRAVPHAVLQDGEPLLVQRGRIGRVGPGGGPGRRLRRPDDPGHGRRSDVPGGRTTFFGPACVTVAVKRGISREAAELYPFDETRQALYEGAEPAVAAIRIASPTSSRCLSRRRRRIWSLTTRPSRAARSPRRARSRTS